MPVAMNDVRIPCSGRGSPCAERSGIESLRCVFEIGSTQCGGMRLIAMPISCAGMPAVARRTICGGVRTESLELLRSAVGDVVRDLGAGVAGADDEHVAAAVRLGVPILRRVHELAGEAVEARPVGDERRAVVARRDDDGRRAAARARSRGASRRRRGRSASTRVPVRTSSPCASRRRRAGTRSGRRARPSGRSGAASAAREGPRGGAACAAAAGRSARATPRPAPGRLRARAGRSPCCCRSAAVASPAEPAPTIAMSVSSTHGVIPSPEPSEAPRPFFRA